MNITPGVRVKDKEVTVLRKTEKKSKKILVQHAWKQEKMRRQNTKGKLKDPNE